MATMEAPRGNHRPHSSARSSKTHRVPSAKGTVRGGVNSSYARLGATMQSSRPGSVPLLWDKNDGSVLTVQSTPLLLATRSLTSSRSTASSSASRPSTGARKRKSRKDGFHPGHERSLKPRPPDQGLRSVSSPSLGLVGGVGGGDVSPRSLSPDIDRFLVDVNAALQSQSPSTSAALAHDVSQSGHLVSRTGKPRPVVAANFTGKSRPASLDPSPGHDSACSSSNGVPETDSGSTKAFNDQPHLLPAIPLPDRAEHRPEEPPSSEAVPPEGSKVGAVQDGGGGRVDAAVKIQRWYRRGRRKEAEEEVRGFLRGKKDELNRSRMEEEQRAQDEADLRQQHQSELARRHAAKMQAVRKAAIEDLQRRREEKRKEVERIAHEEIALLQASGKVRKMKAQRRPKPAAAEGGKATMTGKEGVAKDGGGKEEGEESKERKEDRGREEGMKGVSGATATPSVIDDFFEAGDARKPGQQPPSQPQSTYDEIMDTLRLLEAEPTPLDPSKAGGEPTGYLSAHSLKELRRSDSHPPGSEKLQTILSYLDEVERMDSTALPPRPARARAPPTSDTNVTNQTERSQQGQRSTTSNVSEQLEAATTVASDVTTTILSQRLELDDKQKTVEMLQKALNQQRELTVYHAKEMEKEGQRRLELQQREYEETIQRHQGFIDQLIDDKKVLSERCGTLVTELRELDVKYKQKLKVLEESHTAELTKVKQVAAAADKLRREKWQAEETRRIKEATVKGLEPEIQRIIAKGKTEIQRLKALHEAELLQADERASRRFVAQMEEMRAQCAEEKEHACAHERELARQRYEKLAEQEEMSYQQQRRKLFQEVQQEKERLSVSFEQQRAAMEREWEERQEAQSLQVEELKSQHARALEEGERRHGSELRSLEERTAIERQSWEENYRKRQEVAMLEKEREMREKVRRERDKEIEMVIARLEEETAESKAESERTTEARIKRIREKYETELREVERSERNTLERLNTLRGEMTERDAELARVRSLLRQREAEVEQISEVASKLTRERDSVTDIVRQEFADRLVATEGENKRLKMEMSELRARHRHELERVGREKERGMEAVHERVKQALARKEENLNALRAQHEAALKRAEHLEMLLERQRKELLRK